MNDNSAVKHAVYILMANEMYRGMVDDFARQEYNKKVLSGSMPSDYHYYSGFDIIDTSTIRINYVFGPVKHGHFNITL